MIKELYNLKEELSKRGFFLAFSGPISQNLMVEIGTTLKQKMKLEEASKTTAIRVFSMVVENVQNIIHYSAEKFPTGESDEELSFGIITVGREKEHYFVLCGNLIENKNVENLREKLTKLRHMSKDELKIYYKQQRKQPDAGSKGSGLGFIDMARKANSPIEFDFKKINAELSFFSIKIIV